MGYIFFLKDQNLIFSELRCGRAAYFRSNSANALAKAAAKWASFYKMPRGVTLGMLIATSFPPVLGAEIKRVREAMKTRGAGSVLNPKIFYRAFLVPFVMRLVNISDTLSLSVETRGFSLEKVPYTVYKKEIVCLSDVLFISGLVAGAICAVVL